MHKTVNVCLSWAAAAATVVCLSSAASATVLSWDFTVHPTQEPTPMTAYARGGIWDGGTANGTPYGGAIAGTGLQGDGTAIFADGPTESSNSGFVYGSIGGGFTVDMRVKVLESTNQEGDDKSMSFKQADGNGRGIQLNTNNIQIVSNSSLRTYGVDMATDYQILRFSLPNDGFIYPYLWNGTSWIDLGSQAVTGATGSASEIVAGGFAVGSLAGSSTQSGKFQIDWFAIDNANALGGTGSPLVPEPATLILLVGGLLPLMRHRR